LRLVSNRRETPGTRTIRVALGGRDFDYEAGQAAWLGLDPHDDLTPYSIASAPAETAREGTLQFLVKVDEARRFGAAVAGLRRGIEVFVGGPAGNFTLPPHPEHAHYLFVAGGTGIAPVRSMIVQALATGVPARLSLLYSARRPDEFAYLREFRTLARDGRLALQLTLTGQGERWRHGRGRAGHAQLTQLVGTTLPLCFVCGPPAMVADLTAALGDIGLPRQHIRTEQW
jgi:Na+-transporting NADH:ubiquinone oxidoreductase subunit F